MLGSHPQSAQASTERSRPRSRLLVMKERLQRQRCQQQTSGNCQPNEAKQCPTISTTSESCLSSDNAQAPHAVQSPIKGRRFQRSRHAEQQARSRSQDAVTTTTTTAKKDGFLGCAGGTRPLQKSKSVDMNLEKIVQEADTACRSDTVEVEKLAASGSQKVVKKGSFLFRSSSLLARLSGRSAQKKVQSPSPLRHDGSQSASVENPDDSIGASVNHSVTSSTSSKTASLPEAGRLEILTSSDSAEVQACDSRLQLQTTVATIYQPAVVQSQSDQTQQTAETSFTDLQDTNDMRVCNCSAHVKSSGIPLSRPPCADRNCYEKADALKQGSEIVLAAEMRRSLQRQTSEDLVRSSTHTEDCCNRPLPFHGTSEMAKKPTVRGHRVSISTGNLLNKIPQVRNDFTSSGINGIADTSSKLSVAATVSREPVSVDAVAMTTASSRTQSSEYS